MDDIDVSVAKLRDNDAIKTMLEQICATTEMGFAAVARVSDTRWVACQVVDQIDFGLEPGEELDLKTTICDEIRDSSKAVVIDHVSADAEWRSHPTPILYGFESYISFPIHLADGSFFGTLCAIDPNPRAIDTPATIALFERFAREIGAMQD